LLYLYVGIAVLFEDDCNRIETKSNRVLLPERRVLDVENGSCPGRECIGRRRDYQGSGFRRTCPDAILWISAGLRSRPDWIDCPSISSALTDGAEGISGHVGAEADGSQLGVATLASGVVCVCDMLSPIRIMNRVRKKIGGRNSSRAGN